MSRLIAFEVKTVAVKTAVSYMTIELYDWVVILGNTTSLPKNLPAMAEKLLCQVGQDSMMLYLAGYQRPY